MFMKMFTLKCFVLAVALFLGVLIGMQYANDGIVETKGAQHDDAFSAPVKVSEDPEGNIEATILGEDVEGKTLKEKKEKLEEMKAYNFFSSIGKTIAGLVEGITNKLLDFLSSLI